MPQSPLEELTVLPRPLDIAGFFVATSKRREGKRREERDIGKRKGKNLPLYVPQLWTEIDGYVR